MAWGFEHVVKTEWHSAMFGVMHSQSLEHGAHVDDDLNTFLAMDGNLTFLNIYLQEACYPGQGNDGPGVYH